MCTDDSAAYRALKELDYDHQRTVMLGSQVPRSCVHGRRASVGLADQALDSGHAPWLGAARAPRRLRGRVRLPLQRRTSGSRGVLFYRLLKQAVLTEPVTYDLHSFRPAPPNFIWRCDGPIAFPAERAGSSRNSERTFEFRTGATMISGDRACPGYPQPPSPFLSADLPCLQPLSKRSKESRVRALA